MLLPKCHGHEICTHGLTRINQFGWAGGATRSTFRSCGLTFREATVQKMFLAGIAAAGLLERVCSSIGLVLPKPLVYKSPIAAPP